MKSKPKASAGQNSAQQNTLSDLQMLKREKRQRAYARKSEEMRAERMRKTMEMLPGALKSTLPENPGLAQDARTLTDLMYPKPPLKCLPKR